MNIRSLEQFISVADYKSYSLAAKKVFIAQSSLNTNIKKIEDELGITLFVYDNKTLHLTAEGERFYRLTKDFLKSYEFFSESAKQLSEDVFGTINIILPPLVSDLFFASIVADFQKQYPNVIINVSNRGGFISQNLISVNEFDLAVTIRPLIPNIFEEIDIISSPMVLAVHETHPLASRTSVTYSELKEEYFLSYEEDSVLYQRFVSKMTEIGCMPKIMLNAPETPFLLSVVERNSGILVIPKCVSNYRYYPTIKFIDIEGDENGYQLVLIYKKDKKLSTACQAFVDFVKAKVSNEIKYSDSSFDGAEK